MLRTFAVGVLLGATNLIAPTPALADPPECDRDRTTGKCRISVGGEKTWPAPDKGQGTSSKKPGKSSCQFEGKLLPCSTSHGFWDGASGCYLRRTTAPTLWDAPVVPPGAKVAYYRCWAVWDVIDGKPVGEQRVTSEVRITTTPPPVIDPREAARRVVETMRFVAPRLGLSPYLQSVTREGVVNVPVWMWVTDPGATTTGPQTKTAAVGGVSITATAAVERIEWSMGGGKTVSCKGAGTPFTVAAVKGRALRDVPVSPTCGYRYAKTSRCEPSGAFKVTATAYWNVHWTGGGTQGDIPLQFSRSTSLRVIDLKPVLVDAHAPQTQPPTTGNC